MLQKHVPEAPAELQDTIGTPKAEVTAKSSVVQ
jgi:hypothetical protein